MKQVTTNFAAVFLSGILLLSGLSSCKKSTTEPQRDADSKILADFLQSRAPIAESFTFDAATGTTITNSKGSKYIIPANAFINLDGSPVTGTVKIAIKEMNQVSEMIFGDRATQTGDGRLLTSFGEFFVRAEAGGRELRLRDSARVNVQIKGPAAAGGFQDIPMWDGDTIVTNTINGYNHLNQAATNTQNYRASKGVDWNQLPGNFATPAAPGIYGFRLDSLAQWRNCDAVYNIPGNKTTVLGYFATNFNTATGNSYQGAEPSTLFFKPTQNNTIIKLYNRILNAPAGKDGLHSYQNSMPEGMQGTFLAFSVINGQFYAEMVDVTIPVAPLGQNYVTFTFNPQPVSQTDLANMITLLNTK
jgi:hypothetical protein